MPLIAVSVVLALLLGMAILALWAQSGRVRLAHTENLALKDDLAKQSAEREELRLKEMELRANVSGLEAENRQIVELRMGFNEVTAEKQKAYEFAADLRTQVAQLSTMLENERNTSGEKLALLTAAKQELSNQFEVLAGRILEEKSQRFTEQNRTNLGALLAPIRDKFTEFQGTVESLKTEGITGRTELKTQIEQLRTLNERLSDDASNLVNALRGSSQKQGAWGEYVLESILEASGLRKGHEYRVQESFSREDRSRARIDVILDLPEGRHLVIDSKVSLNDYDEYCNSEDEIKRESALARHLASMRAHIKGLSQQNYHALYGLTSPDYVVMFVPIEPAFMLAVARDSKLWQEAWDKNILLVSPSTLLFVVRTVSQLWRQEQQTRHIQEIVRRGGELYEKLASFAKDLTDVGKRLDDAKQSYDEAVKKLSTGRGNAIRQAEKLRDLGIKPSKNIPIALVEAALDAPEELTAPLFDEPEPDGIPEGE
jgi:DNA recombination protein RmuC